MIALAMCCKLVGAGMFCGGLALCGIAVGLCRRRSSRTERRIADNAEMVRRGMVFRAEQFQEWEEGKR